MNTNNLTIKDRRDSHKAALESFAVDIWNTFDYAANEVIKKLEKANMESNEAKKRLDTLYLNERDRWNEIADKCGISYEELRNQSTQHYIDTIYRDEELQAFCEMKIIYAYKHFEINLKRLISSTYPTLSTKGFYQWDNLKVFFKSKEINIANLVGYQEVNELRIVNNALKHEGITDNSLLKILEFSDKEYPEYTDFKTFYERVKDYPSKFLNLISLAIYNELYVFTDKKTLDLATSLALRMDKETARKFSENLLDLYEE